MTGKDLEWFRQPALLSERNPDASQWPYLGVCPDQGSDGLCGSAFLKFGRCINLEMFYDVSHGVWRDQEASVKDLGLTGWVHLLVVLFNLQHGPFSSSSKFHELHESTDDYMRDLRHDCPLFQHFLCHLAPDYGLEDFLHSPDLPDMAASRMKDDWHGHRGREYDESWTFQALRLIYFGLSQGVFSQSSLSATLEPAKRPTQEASATGEHRVSMAASNDLVNQFRAAARSNANCAAALIMDPLCRPRLRLLVSGVAEIRGWYGEQSKRLRSSQEMCTWMVEQVVGGGINVPLQKTLSLAGDGIFVSKLDMLVDF